MPSTSNPTSVPSAPSSSSSILHLAFLPLQAISLPLLLALAPLTLLLLRRFYYAHLRPLSRYNNIPRPPFVADWLPFIGNALGMTRGEVFWNEAIKGYGPAFRVRAMGEVRTFVTSPQLINYVYKNSKNFDFYFFRRHMQSFIFGMESTHAQSDAMANEIEPQHHRAMQPGSIVALVRRYADLLEDGLERRSRELVAGPNPGHGMVVDLSDYVYDILFEASSKAFFSPSFPSSDFKAPFLAFDTIFPLLNLGKLPRFARRPAERARDKALDILMEWWASCCAGQEKGDSLKSLSPSIQVLVETYKKEGWSERDLASLMLSEIWALEANAPFVGVWAIAQILRRPQLLSRVRSEISSVISTFLPPTLSSLLHVPQPDLPRLLPLSNAIFQETLRFHVDSLSLRIVQEDCVIPPSLISSGIGQESGLGLAIKKGEQVVCATRVLALDGDDWGMDAGVWNPDRFMPGAGGVGEKATLKRGSMSPFGGGVSMCEGRHFASAEILAFIASFIHTFSAEIISDSLIPSTQRPGLGIQQPKGKMLVRLTRREAEA